MQHMFFLLPRPCPIGCRPTAAVAPPEQATTGAPTHPRRIPPPLPEVSFLSFFLPALSHLSLSDRTQESCCRRRAPPELSRRFSRPLLPSVPHRCRATVSMERLRQSSPSRSEPVRNAAAMNLEFKPRRLTSSRAS